MKLTPEQITAIAGQIAGPVTESVTASLNDTITASVGKAVQSAVEGMPTAEQYAELSKALEEARKAGPAPKPPAGDPKGGADAAAAVKELVAPIMEALAKTSEQVQALTQEREQERQRSDTLRLVRDVFGAKRPGLAKDEELIAAVAARSPKDEAAVLAAVEDKRKELARFGAKVERFSADWKEEGGAKGAADGDADKQAAIDDLRALREKRIVDHTRGVVAALPN